jgi:transcriptional regulator with XRE-family HTH domain
MKIKETGMFQIRLCGLMDEHKETQKTLSDDLGVKQQTISLYRNGLSLPDAERLIKISQHYNVSIDWLLGLTNAKTQNANTRVICDATGLSEKSVETLCNIKKRREKQAVKFIDATIENVKTMLMQLEG